MRRLIIFGSKGNQLVGSLDLPATPARVGVLIVSGGNEVRHGAHRGMAMLAQDVAAAGLAVFRFDRAGIGDSAGENGGWAGSKPDILNACLTLINETGVEVVIGFGNCDAAAALALHWGELNVDSAIFANPWTGDEPDALPPPAAIRARYAERLFSPAAWFRLLSGKVDLRKLGGGVGKIARAAPTADLARRVVAGIGDWGPDATVVLAKGDATAIAFRAAAARSRAARTYEIDTASHSFAGEKSRAMLVSIIVQEAARIFEEIERVSKEG